MEKEGLVFVVKEIDEKLSKSPSAFYDSRDTFFYFDGKNEPQPLRKFSSTKSYTDPIIFYKDGLFVAGEKRVGRLNDPYSFYNASDITVEGYIHGFVIHKGRLFAYDGETFFELPEGEIKASYNATNHFFDIWTAIEHNGELYFGGYSGSSKSELFKVGDINKSTKIKNINKYQSPIWALASLNDNLYIGYGMVKGAFPDPNGMCHITALKGKFSYSQPEEIREMVAKDDKLFCSGDFNGILVIEPKKGSIDNILGKFGKIEKMVAVPEDFDIEKYKL